ncbi:bifunctional riboflavin kinase/FAD synthetase [Laceyella putida]|uniref:Riboflavin biosynthesis protein n=1 Tax=Laceyella putida TaxID=110101 RepID=A0ABW2RP21_9BACL
MEIIHVTYPFIPQTPDADWVLAIGYFDGVHRGHQAVIQEAIQLAKELDARPAVMTFDPHPREVLGQAKITRYLTPLNEKLEQFAKLGVERTIVMKFDLTFAALSKESFIEEVLLPLGIKGVVTGFNFTFGRKAAGKAADLATLSQGRFATRVVKRIELEEGTVSSTRLRQALAEGDLKLVTRILGRPYSFEGLVVDGDKRGRQIGFPTANLQLTAPYLIPRRGVYVVHVTYDHESAYGLMNIGVRPTFSDPTLREQLEVHLLDKHVDLYGKILRVSCLSFVREEKKFASVDDLIEQIGQDKRHAEEWLEIYVK